ncbi:hypothetical protein C8F01DRAFT_1251621 [Mycena amicta]|nr:hypothetical protein C8F01DRAFT_1251621 [Mycena amicta]
MAKKRGKVAAKQRADSEDEAEADDKGEGPSGTVAEKEAAEGEKDDDGQGQRGPEPDACECLYTGQLILTVAFQSSPLKIVSVNARSTRTPSSQQPQSKPNSGGAAKRNSKAAMRVADTLSLIGVEDRMHVVRILFGSNSALQKV